MIKNRRRIINFIVIFVFIFASLCSPMRAMATQSKASNFKKTYALTDSQAKNLVEVAKAQLGRTGRDLGYTEAWCADFVSDCAKLAGVSKAIPFDGRAEGLYSSVLAAGGKKVKKAKEGDLVFYYCSACGRIVHSGIMINSKESVEGNFSSKVSLVPETYYVDGRGHRVKTGTVKKRFVRPAYNDGGSFNVASATMKKGTSTKVIKVVLDKKDSVVRYQSLNPSVASVSSKGKITAKKTGTTYIMAETKKGKTAVVKLKVQKGNVQTKKITVRADDVELDLEETYSLKAKVSPITSSYGLSYKTSDDSIVTVSEKGKIEAVGSGNATITVTSGKVKVKVAVTVIESEVPEEDSGE